MDTSVNFRRGRTAKLSLNSIRRSVMSAPSPIVVIGTSTGGLGALKKLLGALPPAFAAPVVITMHISDGSMLPELLGNACAFPVRYARDGDALQAGEILVARPGSHVLVGIGRVHLGNGAKENFCRPAIDPMFRSAAYSYKQRVIGVLLTGNLDDGTVGLQAIQSCGGVVIVQDPSEAEASSMPLSALQHVNVDYCLPLQGIADTLAELISSDSERVQRDASEALAIECDLDLHPSHATTETMDGLAPRSPLVCPECQGVLWEMQSSPLRYRCHTGHAFTAQTFAQSQNRSVEEALWVAIRATRDKEVFFKRQQAQAMSKGKEAEAKEYGLAASHARDTAETLVHLATANVVRPGYDEPSR